MNIQIVCAGRTPSSFEQAWIDEYVNRCEKFAQIKIVRVRERVFDTPARTASETWKSMKPRLEKQNQVAVLDPKGKLLSTEKWVPLFAAGGISFVVGGSYGLPQAASLEADHLISLSPLTLPHRLALLILSEQIYRVLTIRAGTPYHH